MRLPTLTPQQSQREDARAFHEALYEAWMLSTWTPGKPNTVTIPTTPAEALRTYQERQWRNHKFWRARGFLIRAKIAKDRTSVAFWLEPKTEGGRVHE